MATGLLCLDWKVCEILLLICSGSETEVGQVLREQMECGWNGRVMSGLCCCCLGCCWKVEGRGKNIGFAESPDKDWLEWDKVSHDEGWMVPWEHSLEI